MSSLDWQERPFRQLVSLAWPIAISMLSYSVMTLVDTLFVGRLGPAALAGVSVGGITFFTLLCFGFGLLRAVKVVVSQAVGAGQVDRTPSFVGAGLLLAALLGVLTFAASRLASGAMVHVSASLEAARHAADYLDVRALSAPFALAAIALREARYGTGDAKTPMRATIIANAVNIALDYVLIFHLGYGVVGAAASTVLATALDAGLLALAQRGEGFGYGSTSLAEVRAIWKMGVPMGVQHLLEVSSFALLTFIFASMSEVDVAAHQIALQVAHFSFLPALALGDAASVLAGQAVGARKNRLVKVVARKTLLAAAAYTGFCGLLFAVFPELMARAFTDDPALIKATVHLLYVAAIFQVFDGAYIVARCVLRGTGDVRYAAVVGVVVAWICTPPLALLLGYALGLGALGGWIGLCLEIMVGSAILWRRLETGRWLRAARRARAELDAGDIHAAAAPAQ